MRQQRRDRREAHDGRAHRRQREEGVDEQRRPDEVDRDDLAPVGHGRGHAGRMGDGAQRAQLRCPRRQAGDTFGVLDVEPEGLDLRRRTARREALRRFGEDELVAVDQQQDVDHVRNSFGTGPPHAPAPPPSRCPPSYAPPRRHVGFSGRERCASTPSGVRSKSRGRPPDLGPDHRCGGPSGSARGGREAEVGDACDLGACRFDALPQAVRELAERGVRRQGGVELGGRRCPSAANGSCRSEAKGALAKCRPAASPPPTLPPFHSTARVVAAMSPSAWASTPSHPTPDLALGRRLLRQLVGEIAAQALAAVLEDAR